MGAAAMGDPTRRIQPLSRRGAPVPSRTDDEGVLGAIETNAVRDALLRDPNPASVVSALARADASTQVRAITRLQQQHGNAFVQRVVAAMRGAPADLQRRTALQLQRQPAGLAAPAAATEWQAHPRIHHHFAGGLQTYEALRPLYQARGIQNPAAYLDQHIVQVTFLGHRTPAHRDMTAPLQTAQQALNARGVVPTIHSFWAFVPRRTAGGSLSNHALGRAVDINPSTNPHIKNAQEILVIEAVTGVNLGQRQAVADMRTASRDFQSNFNQTWIDQKRQELQQLQAQHASRQQIGGLRRLLAAIRARRAALNRYATSGFLDLDQELLDELTNAGFGWGGNYQRSKDFMHFELP